MLKDFGPRMTDHKRGLKQLLEQIIHGQVSRLTLTHKNKQLIANLQNAVANV